MNSCPKCGMETSYDLSNPKELAEVLVNIHTEYARELLNALIDALCKWPT